MGSARWALLVCMGVLGFFLAVASPAFALSRAQADAVALKAFGRLGSRAQVYGLLAALPAGAVISDAGPGPGVAWSSVVDGGPSAGETLTATVPTTTLSEPGWLFWDDPSAAANFPHASRLMLVDDSGQVTWTKSLAWWPLVNGKPAAFATQPKNLASYRVTAGVAVSAASSGATHYANECMVALYSPDDPRKISNFEGDAKAMLKLAAAYGVEGRSTTTAGGLVSDAGALIKGGCKDVTIFLAGHGQPATGAGSTTEPAVLLSSTSAPGPNGSDTFVAKGISAKDIAGLIDFYRAKANFKLVINSCYAGRFEEALAHQSGLVLVATASSATEVSWQERYATANGGEIENDGGTDHPDGAGLYVTGLTRAFTAIIDGDDKQIQADNLTAARNNFAYALKLAAEQASFYGDFAAADGLTHPVVDFDPTHASTLTQTPTATTTTTPATKPATSSSGSQSASCTATTPTVRPDPTGNISLEAFMFTLTCNFPLNSVQVAVAKGCPGDNCTDSYFANGPAGGYTKPAGWTAGASLVTVTYNKKTAVPANTAVAFAPEWDIPSNGAPAITAHSLLVTAADFGTDKQTTVSFDS
jgi:hypothetical protein